MRFASSIIAALLLSAGVATAASVGSTMDPNHTRINFSWTHFGLSHPMGRFDHFDGDFRFDPTDPTKSSVTVTIPVDSIDTGVAKLDAHLKSPDFFDAAKYPVATFKSTRVERSGEHGLKVTGDLTLHGVTKPVVLDVVVNKIGPHPMAGRPAAGFDATATIKRSDFGISNYVPKVSDEIELSISTEAMVPAAAGEAQ
jgi:polyisoprenoid-binding protein YceI